MNSSCVFCKIAAGGIAAAKVFETDTTLAFMDVNPLIKGHVLVIPRMHVERLTDASPGLLADVAALVRRVAAAQQERLGAGGVNVLQNNGSLAGQVVPHLHVHVIPRFPDDGLRWPWPARKYDQPAEMERLARILQEAKEKAGTGRHHKNGPGREPITT